MSTAAKARFSPACAAREEIVRLELLTNDWGWRAVKHARPWNAHLAQLETPRLQSLLTDRIADLLYLRKESITLGSCIDSLLSQIVGALPPDSVMMIFRPSDDAVHGLVRQLGLGVEEVSREELLLGASGVAEKRTRKRAIAYVQSPNDPTGEQLSHGMAAALAASFGVLIVDERHCAFAIRNHLPLLREFDNVVLLRTVEPFSGQAAGYALANRRTISHLQIESEAVPDRERLLTALHTFDNQRYLAAALREIVRQRVVLYRSLRKLNMLQPRPSSANFLLCELTRGDRDSLRAALIRASVAVHYPDELDLLQTIRVSAVSRRSSRALVTALVEWAREL